jgi:hypothetical protein
MCAMTSAVIFAFEYEVSNKNRAPYHALGSVNPRRAAYFGICEREHDKTFTPTSPA